MPFDRREVAVGNGTPNGSLIHADQAGCFMGGQQVW